jgi:hypothetical protein
MIDGVGALQLGDLFPAGLRLGEHVHPARTGGVVPCTHNGFVPEMATEMPNQSLATESEPFSSASRVPIDGVARGLAATTEAVFARNGKVIAPTTMRLAMEDTRMWSFCERKRFPQVSCGAWKRRDVRSCGSLT